MILAGDFNISSQFDPPWDERARKSFGQLEDLGFVNVLAKSAATRGRLEGCLCTDEPCPHYETWMARSGRGTKPRHNDYVFVSEDLGPTVREVRVDPIDHSLSDHAPVVVDLDLAD